MSLDRSVDASHDTRRCVMLDAVKRLAARGWIARNVDVRSKGPLRLLVSCISDCSCENYQTTPSAVAAARSKMPNRVVGSVETVGCGAELLSTFSVSPACGPYEVKCAIARSLGWPDDSFRVFVGHGGPELHNFLEHVPNSPQSLNHTSTNTRPLRDGFLLVVLRRPSLPSEWTAILDTGKPVVDPWGCLDMVRSIVCSRSGLQLAAICDEYPEVGIFSLLDPRPRWLPNSGGDVINGTDAHNVALSPDGTLVAVAYQSGEVSLFDLSSKTQLPRRVICSPKNRNSDERHHRNHLNASSMGFSLTGRWIAIAGPECIRVYNVKSGAELLSIEGKASHVVFVQSHASGDSELLATYQHRMNEIRVVDVPTGNVVTHFPVGSPVAFSSCGKYVAWGHTDISGDRGKYSVRVRDLRSSTDEILWESPATAGNDFHFAAVCGGNIPRLAILWQRPVRTLEIWDFSRDRVCLSISANMLPADPEFNYHDVRVHFFDEGRFLAVSTNASMGYNPGTTSIRLWHLPDEIVFDDAGAEVDSHP